uniref:Uncharacterized protein n=1 Tax=Cyanothece sp. (strain PCC 7425 / ATCC 29141) TaxID=395961 RepID=B8HYH9_CYAP4
MTEKLWIRGDKGIANYQGIYSWRTYQKFRLEGALILGKEYKIVGTRTVLYNRVAMDNWLNKVGSRSSAGRPRKA